jgi:hypothetical protein
MALRKHHQSASFLVGKLLRPVPFSPDPLLIVEQLVVVIGERGRREGPWSFETRAIWMTSTESVGTGEGDNFLVIESTVESQETQSL